MKQFRIMLAVFLVILLVVGMPVSVAAKEWNAKNSDDIENAFATDTDAEVVINLENDITMDRNTVLEAKENQNYTINGNGSTISDVNLRGSGNVVIEADVESNRNVNALYTAEEVTVTVNGNITSSNGGVAANGDSSVTITGDVTAEDYAIATDDNAQVSVTGDVSAENYETVSTYGNSEVTINGDVHSGEFGDGAIVAYENSKVDVTGDITSELSNGIFAFEESTVTVTGDVSVGEYSGIYAGDSATVTLNGNIDAGFYGVESDGDDTNVTVNGNITAGNIGILASFGANIEVTGDVQSGSYLLGELTEEELLDPYAYSDGFSGIEASDDATVTVTGNVTAGNAQGTYGAAGNGIEASGDATVTVTGNVSGGSVSTNPDTISEGGCISTGGHGVLASGGAAVSVGGDVTGGGTNGESGIGGSGIYATGSATVAVSGNVQGGDSTAANGSGGHGIYAKSDNTITVGSVTAGDVTGVTDFGSNVTAGDATGANGVGGNGIHLVAGRNSGYATGSIRVENTVTGGKSGTGNASNSLYFESYSPNSDPYFADVYVWELSDENGNIAGTDSNKKTAQEIAKENVCYYIRYIQPSEGIISTNVQQAKQDDVVTVTGDRAFAITYSANATDDPIELEAGKYTIVTPLGGAVLIQATPLGSSESEPEPEPEETVPAVQQDGYAIYTVDSGWQEDWDYENGILTITALDSNTNGIKEDAVFTTWGYGINVLMNHYKIKTVRFITANAERELDLAELSKLVVNSGDEFDLIHIGNESTLMLNDANVEEKLQK